ncbi:hypothetical protein ACP4OV_029414 [Aristida adscensionis]
MDWAHLSLFERCWAPTATLMCIIDGRAIYGRVPPREQSQDL